MRPFGFLGEGVNVWWLALSAMVTVFATAFALALKRAFGWMLRRAKAGFVEWFGAAIDEHVAPKFEEIRTELHEGVARTQENTNRAAAELKDETAQIASELKDRLDSHASHDDRVMTAAGDALVQGQQNLQRQMQEQHAESMGVIQQHVQDDAAAFARIEETLESE